MKFSTLQTGIIRIITNLLYQKELEGVTEQTKPTAPESTSKPDTDEDKEQGETAIVTNVETHAAPQSPDTENPFISLLQNQPRSREESKQHEKESTDLNAGEQTTSDLTWATELAKGNPTSLS
ncbi:hypothetical protein R1flu_000974 [Riccia fluitans]|uniref:Uncharacterized protein n=1 Tax=Riccia fluitans TaxID=41844 RepID=A0ABD1Y2Y2_9MARC